MSFSKLYHGDCLNEMKQIPDKSVDLILTDLPYGTTACSWDIVIPFDQLWTEYNRIKKDNAIVVLTASQPFTTVLINSNIKAFKYEWIWEKHQGTNFLAAKKQPLKIHENICIFYDKPGTYNPQKTFGHVKYKEFASDRNKTVGSVYGSAKSVHKENDGSRYPKSVIKFSKEKTGLHPTQKPIELMKYLIQTYSNEGDVILDSCMGSGTCGVASKLLERNFIGIEKEQEYFEIAKKRITESGGLLNF